MCQVFHHPWRPLANGASDWRIEKKTRWMLFADDNNKQAIFLFKKLRSSHQSPTSTFQTFEHVEPCCSRVVTSLVRFDRCSALIVKHEPGTTIEATTASRRSHPTTVRDENSRIQRETKVSASLSLTVVNVFFFSPRQTKDGLVDATPEVRKSLEDTLTKLKNAFGAESEDLLSVPKLDFKGEPLD